MNGELQVHKYRYIEGSVHQNYTYKRKQMFSLTLVSVHADSLVFSPLVLNYLSLRFLAPPTQSNEVNGNMMDTFKSLGALTFDLHVIASLFGTPC